MKAPGGIDRHRAQVKLPPGQGMPGMWGVGSDTVEKPRNPKSQALTNSIVCESIPSLISAILKIPISYVRTQKTKPQGLFFEINHPASRKNFPVKDKPNSFLPFAYFF